MTVAARSKRFHPLEHRDRGFEFNSRHRCLSVPVFPCVGSGFAMGSSPVRGVLPTVYEIHNFIILNGNRPKSLTHQGGRRRRRNCLCNLKCLLSFICVTLYRKDGRKIKIIVISLKVYLHA
jgi:hypothetical protein